MKKLHTTITVTITNQKLDNFRKSFDIDNNTTNKKLTTIIVQKILDRYLDPQYFAENFFENNT